MSSESCTKELTEEQEQLLKSLEEEFKDRYTETDEGFLATLKEAPPLPPVIENWRDFARQDRGRSMSNHHFRGDQERRRFGFKNSDRSKTRNHQSNSNRWH